MHPGYPGADHPMRALVMGEPPRGFQVPNLDELVSAGGDSDGRAVHKTVDDMLAPPRQPIAYAEAQEKILAVIAPHPELAVEEREEAFALYQEALNFFAKVESFRERRKTNKLDSLQRRHREAYEQSRVALDQTKRFHTECGFHHNLLHALDERRNKAQAEVGGIRSRKPRPSSYPTQTELDTWREALRLAEEELAKIESEYQGRQHLLAVANEQLSDAQRQLSAARSEEQDLRAQLNGDVRRRGGLEIKEPED